MLSIRKWIQGLAPGSRRERSVHPQILTEPAAGAKRPRSQVDDNGDNTEGDSNAHDDPLQSESGPKRQRILAPPAGQTAGTKRSWIESEDEEENSHSQPEPAPKRQRNLTPESNSTCSVSINKPICLIHPMGHGPEHQTKAPKRTHDAIREGHSAYSPSSHREIRVSMSRKTMDPQSPKYISGRPVGSSSMEIRGMPWGKTVVQLEEEAEAVRAYGHYLRGSQYKGLM